MDVWSPYLFLTGKIPVVVLATIDNPVLIALPGEKKLPISVVIIKKLQVPS